MLTLVHDGRAVIESTLIAEYLDEAFPAVAFRHQDLALSPEELGRNIDETPDPARRERKRLGIEKGMEAPFVPGGSDPRRVSARRRS